MDGMRPLSVFLIDEHTMLVEALATALLAYPDIDQTWCASIHAADLETQIRDHRPDVITAEIDTTTGTSTELLPRLTAGTPRRPVVVLTANRQPHYAVHAARAGADAWVPKEQPIADLVAVLRGIARGNAWYPPRLLGPVLRALREQAPSAPALHTLTSREAEILRQMTCGHSGARIAAELGVAAETVRTHIRGILTKLDVHSRLEAVTLARRHGWGHANCTRETDGHSPDTSRP